jgi:hypothetical protein
MNDPVPDPISRRDMLRRTATGMVTLALGTNGTDARPPARQAAQHRLHPRG